MVNKEKNNHSFLKKGIAIIVLLICLIAFSAVAVCNSDWYINKNLSIIKRTTDFNLGQHVTLSCKNKYEKGILKTNLVINNVDPRVIEMAIKYKIINNDTDLLTLVFVDDDRFKISELKIYKKDLKERLEVKGQYEAQLSQKIEKSAVKKIKDIEPKFREILDARYEDIFKKRI